MPEPTFFMDFPQVKIWGWGREDVRPDRPESTYHGYIAYDIPRVYISNNDRYWVDITSGIIGDSYTVKVSVDDTTAAYLEDKVVVLAPLAITVLNPGANEQLQLSIPTGSITADLLADDYSLVGHTHILADITDAGVLAGLDSVGAGQIDADAVGSSELADNAVDTNAIQNGAVTAAKIATDTITANEIAPNAIGSSELADNSVDTNAIIDDAVTLAKLASGTAGKYIGFDGSGNPAELSGASGGDSVRVYHADFTQATSSPLTLFTPDANADIVKVVVEITTIATGGGSGALLKVGTVADDDAYVETDQVNLYSAGNYIIECWMNVGGSPAAIILTLTPDSNTFAGTVNVFHVVPT